MERAESGEEAEAARADEAIASGGARRGRARSPRRARTAASPPPRAATRRGASRDRAPIAAPGNWTEFVRPVTVRHPADAAENPLLVSVTLRCDATRCALTRCNRPDLPFARKGSSVHCETS